MKSSHCLIKVGLKRCIAALFQSVIAQVTFEAFYHSLHRWSAFHDSFESFGHRRILWVDMSKYIKWYLHGTTRFGSGAAVRFLSAAIANACLVGIQRRLVNEFLSFLSYPSVIHIEVGIAYQVAVGCKFLHPFWQVFRHGLFSWLKNCISDGSLLVDLEILGYKLIRISWL